MQKRSVKLHLYVGYINRPNDSTGKKVTYSEIFSSRGIFTARKLNYWQKTKTLKSPALFFLQSKSDQSGTSFLDVVPDQALRYHCTFLSVLGKRVSAEVRMLLTCICK